MAAARSIILVTGGNSGIGLETVRQLAAQSKHVLLGSRTRSKGEQAVNDLQAEGHPGTVEFLEIDVTKKESIVAAAKAVETSHGRLDALVNNAAIASFPDGTSLDEKMRLSFETNAIGPLLVVQNFAPLLKKSITTPRIVNVSSGAGSITRRMRADPNTAMAPDYYYRSSKAALNMVTAEQNLEFASAGFKVFAYCPGFCVSSLSPFNRAEKGAKPASEGVRFMIDILNGTKDAEAPAFFESNGTTYEW